MLLCHGTQCLVSRPSLGTNSIFWPPANAADPAQVSSCRLQGWMLHGCGCKLRAAMLQADRLHGCKLRGCRLQGFRLQVVRLQAARLQATCCALQVCKPQGRRVNVGCCRVSICKKRSTSRAPALAAVKTAHVLRSSLCTLLRSWSRLDSLLRTLFGDSDGGGQAQSSRPTQPDCTAHHFTLHYLSVWIAGADRTSSNGARQYPAGHQPSNPYPIGPFQANTLHRQFFEESHHTIVLSVSEALIPTDQPGLNQPASQYVASLSTANLVTRSAAAAGLTRALVYRGQLCLLCSAAVC
jgi:hypothetical protein